jgi:multidrug efflux system membrane fusion protein
VAVLQDMCQQGSRRRESHRYAAFQQTSESAVNIPRYRCLYPAKTNDIQREPVEEPTISSSATIRPQRARAGRWLVGGIALLLVLSAFAYLNRANDRNANRAARNGAVSAAVPVRVAFATRRDVPVVEHTIGTVVANTAVQVTARVQGVIEAAHFREGDFVAAGDLLFEIDPRPYKAALAQARAQLAKDQAQLQNAVSTEKRQRSIFEQHLTSSEALDAAVAATGSARAVVDADQAAVDLAQLNLDYTRIHAPVDGKTGPMLVQPGNLVTANGSAPLVTINQIQPIKVSFALPQTDLPRIQARAANGGLTAAIDQRGEGGSEFAAPVDFVSNHVDQSSGTIELRATFANADAALVPGQLVDVTVELDMLPNVTVVPREAVVTGPEGLFAYVVTPDDRVAVRNLRVLFDDGKDDAIAGDIQAGDRVVVDGQLRLVPGASVAPDAAAQLPADAQSAISRPDAAIAALPVGASGPL